MAPPNFIIMLADNAGYGDLSCYGSRLHRTPSVDRIAREGVRFTDFYSTSGVCTPSRASLMTGCYPIRVDMHENCDGGWVLLPGDRKGLNPDELTVAKLLRSRGYRTACIGKWHLGDQPKFLPTRHGFDEYLGVPYSEDMVPGRSHPEWPPLPLMRGEKVIDSGVDRNYLTRIYTEEGLRFIDENSDSPFFLYLSHAMPGSTPSPFASPSFSGRSRNGRYGDSIEELDWSAGRVLDALEGHGIADRTLVIWTSDNGAVEREPRQGSNDPLKGWGYSTSEGGQRVPFVACLPDVIPKGTVCGEIATMMDLLPTLAGLAGALIPESLPIDGFDMLPLLKGDAHSSPYDETGFFYYHMDQLQAVRAGDWKLYLPLERKILSHRDDVAPAELALYNLAEDISEREEVSEEHAEVVSELMALAGVARRELGDEGRKGSGHRPAGWVGDPVYPFP